MEHRGHGFESNSSHSSGWLSKTVLCRMGFIYTVQLTIFGLDKLLAHRLFRHTNSVSGQLCKVAKGFTKLRNQIQ